MSISVGSPPLTSATAVPFTVAFADPCVSKVGHWAGSTCDVCAAGYYGPACLSPCPGLPGPACGGHGVCSSGLEGDGTCQCDEDAVRGRWAGAACAQCQDGYAGANCTVPCPAADVYGVGVNVTCGGHGACDEGVAGLGTCSCALPWAGAACDVQCPADAAQTPCAGHGVCLASGTVGAGRCACAAGNATGHWAGPACEDCAAGWAGPGCTGLCPSVAGAAVCAGHGQCVWAGAAAACECDVGFVGRDCAAACPRDLGTGALCGGHGVCRAAGGGAAVCNCTADGTAGHWGGAVCTACARGYGGPQCARQCPVGPDGTVCSGNGTCVADGMCTCSGGACGAACETPAADCQAASCPPGLYGLQCDRQCSCGANSACLDGPYGSGACMCHVGWAGARCDIPCAGGATDPPCSGHGQCHPQTGACACLDGWRSLGGAACNASCPASGGLTCAGRGTCNASAHCECGPGYGGAACATPCPRDAAGHLCGGHGVCGADAACTCARDAAEGHWGGAACGACAPGYFGARCERVCVAGTTVGTVCQCLSGWFREDCSQECPGGAGNPCTGHGTCDTAGDGACACQTGYIGPACAQQCPLGAATGLPCNGHGACVAATVTCACDEGAAGHWAGAACDMCRAPYFGPACTLRCPEDPPGAVCGGHGTCTPAGSCACLAAPDGPHWDGPACSVCAAGYYGGDCSGRCLGDGCTPCGGHGVCHDGRTGNGTCTCAGPGRWAAAAGCSDCLPGYYGPSCRQECPGGAQQPCGGHGTCVGGVTGSGACECVETASGGRWAGPGCGVCVRGWFGPRCNMRCPLGATGDVCSGAGSCADGLSGTGLCRCDVGAVGPACEFACASAAGLPCNGHGACALRSDGAAAVCECVADAVAGHWTGPACETCAAGFWGIVCAAECPGGAAAPCSGHGVCAGGRTGSGECACDVGYRGAACAVPCPGLAEGRVCNGHGQCDAAAACVCAPGDAVAGHWAGAGCVQCAEGWSGVDCATPCPRGASGAVCSGRGRCSAGQCTCDSGACGGACDVTGALCTLCEAGTWGPACRNECPGGRADPCGGHGQCSDGVTGYGACLCAAGYGLANCSAQCPGGGACAGHGACSADTAQCVCDAGHAGPACAAACPRTAAGDVCGGPGRGSCRDGAGGDGGCACAAGYAGAVCEIECPGRGPQGPCAGHGACDPANGTCACDPHWAGAACEGCAPGWHGPQCHMPCYQGTTEGRVCLCAQGWAGANCSTECRGGAAVPCSGHGACNATRFGDGSCACDAAWRGPVCAAPCPGLMEAGAVCSGHGTCRADATCVCTRAPSDGYWAGAACGGCEYGYVGVGCALRCPLPGGVVCGGHGACGADTGQCQCYASDPDGFWDGQRNCTDCLAGYWGAQCRGVCPGGSCAVCSGHGACDDRRAGNGTCTCDPQWAAMDCSMCAPTWYGPDCNSSCPTAASATGIAAVCAAHGVCRDGRFGSGECVCEQTAAAGMWAGPACGDCLAGHWGPGCVPCPGGGAGPCSGHGRCADGVAGTGQCACDVGYGGAACERSCPSHAGRVCNGVGRCDTERAVCNCSAAPAGQHWVGDACQVCAPGFVGVLCAAPCPRAGPEAAVCAGSGACQMGPGNTAVCVCGGGYYGPVCESECPGGADFPCSSHGTCDPASGACACEQSAARGYWTGPSCGECVEGWSGTKCTTACPVGADGRACSGFRCREGVCDCDDDLVCGVACNVTGPPCDALSCPAGRYGQGCAQECPRAGPGGAYCSGHGMCVAKVYGDGACHCGASYTGPYCGVRCPGPEGDPCSGHGDCNATGVCRCYTGFAGLGCDLACLRSGGEVCAGHGWCRETDGGCTCAMGYAGPVCAALCPGFDPGDPWSRSCSGHGVCVQATMRCECMAAPEAGYWAGTVCDACASGWFGEACDRRCVAGRTEGRVCVCDPGYGLPNCSAACPGHPAAPCSGHGLCRDNHTRDGTCACDTDWYTADCSVRCRAGDCFAADTYPAPHAQCNPDTGRCECQRNETGHWAGAECNVCAPGYWGLTCANVCDCNDNGVCGWLDGICACFGDEERGFWAGEHCQSCLAGYLEPICRAKNVAISRPLEVPVQAEEAAALVADEHHQLIYAGGNPLLVFDSGNDNVLTSFALGGTVRYGPTRSCTPPPQPPPQQRCA